MMILEVSDANGNTIVKQRVNVVGEGFAWKARGLLINLGGVYLREEPDDASIERPCMDEYELRC